MIFKKFLLLIVSLFVLFNTASAAEFEMVEYSAHVKLQWLAAAGIPEAQEFLKNLNKPNYFSEDNLKDFERIEKVNGVFQEINYAAVNNFIKNNSYNNVFDIACSYSPRVVNIVKDGGNYVGAELAAVAFVADGLAKKSIDKKLYDKFNYEEVPVENEELMLGASSNFKGEVCIVENGLMIYLTKDRIDSMFKNIKEILIHHGGCMITTDFAMKKYFTDTAAALYGNENAQTLYNETKEMYEKVLEDKVIDDHFTSEKQAINYLNSMGLKVEQVPLLPSDYSLYSYKHLTDEQMERVKKLVSQKYLWVITVGGKSN